MSEVILKNITKTYDGENVIEDVNITLESNKIYALLGRNGAGKTTLMKIMSGQVLPSKGNIIINGESTKQDEKDFASVCYVKEDFDFTRSNNLYTVKAIFKHARLLYDEWDEAYAKKLIKKFNIPMKKRYKALSKGLKTSVSLIIGLASNTAVTLFDEPYVGLDPIARSYFYDEIHDIQSRANERIILISSHMIMELEMQVEHVMMIKEGKIILSDAIENIQECAFVIRGHKDKMICSDLRGKILNEKIYGNNKQVYFYGELDSHNRRVIEKNDLTANRMGLQELFVEINK